MKAGKILLLTAGTVLLQCCSVFASEPEAVVRFTAHSRVSHADVTLGDISEITSLDQRLMNRLRSLNLGAAPVPGYSRRIDVAYVRNRIRSEGVLEQVQFAGPTSATVESPHFEVRPERMKLEVERYVTHLWPMSTGEVTVEFKRPLKTVAVPTETVELKVLPGNSTDLRGDVLISVGVFVDGKLYKRVPVSAKVRTFEMVAVARKAIARYQMLTADDVSFEMRETTRLRHSPVHRIDDMRGMRATRTIGPGRLIDKSMLDVPPVIKRGDRVIVVARVRNVTVKVPATAREDGRVGDVISVTNVNSRKRLFARVENSQTVTVMP